MNVAHWWNNTDRVTQKYKEKILSHGHLVCHKYHIDWPGIKAGSLWCNIVVM